MKDKISVIIPVYNIKDYIERAVKSVLAQTYTNIELVLVDDGSTDGSSELLDQLCRTDNRIIVLHKENGGVTSARLYGTSKATGNWIGFVDGDDVIEPDMYERLLSNALKYNADISHCGYQMCFPDRTDFYYNTGKILIQDHETAQVDIVEGKFVEPSLCNKLFRNSLLDKLLQSRKMDRDLRYMEDLLMNYYLFSYATISVYEDFCPYYYMIHKGSAMTTDVNIEKLEDPLAVFKEIYADSSILKIREMAEKRIISYLIKLSSMKVGKSNQSISILRDHARKELKEKIPAIIKENWGIYYKSKALWAAVWPDSYMVMRRLYSRATGIDHKYEVKQLQ